MHSKRATDTKIDGSEASMTGPPPPLPHYLNAEGRALARFAVEGKTAKIEALKLNSSQHAPHSTTDL